MQTECAEIPLRIGIPKGRMYDGVVTLLTDAGLDCRLQFRQYRPLQSRDGIEAKILKPKSIVEMVHAGSRDIGFAGADWVTELDADVVELLDTGLDPIRIVAACPEGLLSNQQLPNRKLVIASEYPKYAVKWIEQRSLDAAVIASYGSTEVFPPEDADCIVDCVASGNTLKANGLTVIDVLATSSTRLYGCPAALRDPKRRQAIESFTMLVRSVLQARQRVMIEVNVSIEQLDAVIAILPCMRQPTVSSLHGQRGYAVKAAVPRDRLRHLIPDLKARGGTDLVVTKLSQIVL